MSQVSFGSGNLIGIPSGSNPTPAIFGVLQNVDIDFNAQMKELFGQNSYPVAVARAATSIKGKASFAQINARMYNSLFFNGTLTSNAGIGQVANETGSIPASSAYTVTVTNSATWTTDEGVFFAATGIQLTRVASAPTAGQYSVAAGVYTFAAADAGKSVYISYLYTLSASAQKITINNGLMGVAPTFQMNLGLTYNNQIFNIQLNACTSNKLGFAFKNTDFTIPDFEFSAFADASNTVGYITTSE